MGSGSWEILFINWALWTDGGEPELVSSWGSVSVSSGGLGLLSFPELLLKDWGDSGISLGLSLLLIVSSEGTSSSFSFSISMSNSGVSWTRLAMSGVAVSDLVTSDSSSPSVSLASCTFARASWSVAALAEGVWSWAAQVMLLPEPVEPLLTSTPEDDLWLNSSSTDRWPLILTFCFILSLSDGSQSQSDWRIFISSLYLASFPVLSLGSKSISCRFARQSRSPLAEELSFRPYTADTSGKLWHLSSLGLSRTFITWTEEWNPFARGGEGTVVSSLTFAVSDSWGASAIGSLSAFTELFVSTSWASSLSLFASDLALLAASSATSAFSFGEGSSGVFWCSASLPFSWNSSPTSYISLSDGIFFSHSFTTSLGDAFGKLDGTSSEMSSPLCRERLSFLNLHSLLFSLLLQSVGSRGPFDFWLSVSAVAALVSVWSMLGSPSEIDCDDTLSWKRPIRIADFPDLVVSLGGLGMWQLSDTVVELGLGVAPLWLDLFDFSERELSWLLLPSSSTVVCK